MYTSWTSKLDYLSRIGSLLEDVVTHSSQIKKERRRGGASVAVTGDSSALSTTGLGGLTKANQQKLEVLGVLFIT